MKKYEKPEVLLLSFDLEDALMSGLEEDDSDIETSGIGGGSNSPWSFG